MASTTPPTYVFGAHQIGPLPAEDIHAFTSILHAHGITHIDTATAYPDSEKRLGEAGAPKSFTIDTKAPGYAVASLSRASLAALVDESLKLLQTDKVDVYYLHGPDDSTPIEETVDAIQDLHRQGKFARFGLSNFSPEAVRRIHAYASSSASSSGGVVPTVYQGIYNALTRHAETRLLPVLRELGIAYYAYSPLAAGFFAKDPDELAARTSQGRFEEGAMGAGIYNALYSRPPVFDALRRWKQIANEAGVSSVMLAYRWVVFHSALDGAKGDAVIIGASRPRQLEQTLQGLEAGGPLGRETVERIEEVWKMVEGDATLANWIGLVEKEMKAAYGV